MASGVVTRFEPKPGDLRTGLEVPDAGNGGSTDVAPARYTRQAAAWSFLAIGACVALGPLLLSFGRRLWSEDHYRFFPLLLCAAGWLGWTRYRAASAVGLIPGAVRGRVAAWTAATLATAAALATGSPLVAFVATLAIGLAAVYERGGFGLVRTLLPVWVLTLLIVPPPFGWDRKFVVSLQQVATSFASGLLDLSGIRHVADGVAIRLPGSEFFVDAGCSGIHSLFASLTFAGVVSIVAGHGPVRTSVLLAASTAWVILANAVRVFAVVVLSDRYRLPVVEGIGHEAVGLVTFAAIIGLILSTDRLLLFLFPGGRGFFGAVAASLFRRRGRSAARPVSAGGNSGRRPTLRGVVIAGTVLLGLGLGDRLAGGSSVERAVAGSVAPKPVAAGVLPDEWEGWKRLEFDVRRRSPLDPAGEWSRIWTYRKGLLTAAISLDGPYAEWHDLTSCYLGGGHEIVATRHEHPPGPDSDPFTELQLRRAGRRARVLFSAYTFSDRPVPPPGAASRRLANILDARYARFAGGESVRGSVYQVQLFTEGWLPFTPADERELEALFKEMRRRVRQAEPAPSGGADEGVGR